MWLRYRSSTSLSYFRHSMCGLINEQSTFIFHTIFHTMKSFIWLITNINRYCDSNE